jgi:hypothetical protein
VAQKAGGVGIYTCDDVTIIVDTAKCQHCQAPIAIPDRRKLTDYADICRNCNGFICLKAECNTCTPWLKRIEAQEAAFYKREQFRKSMGF